MAIGRKTGGRSKGSLNKTKSGLAAKLSVWKCDPFHTLALACRGDLPCNVCRGKGRTRYQAAGDAERSFDRICQSCYGSKYEKISPGERIKAASELAQYIEAKRKAIEHSGPEGGAIQHRHEIVFVE